MRTRGSDDLISSALAVASSLDLASEAPEAKRLKG